MLESGRESIHGSVASVSSPSYMMFWLLVQVYTKEILKAVVSTQIPAQSNDPNNWAEREVEARRVRRIFSSPPRDPRYHMLDYLAPKFTYAPQPTIGEPRAALILNRFSRTLSIMYSTNAVANILNVTAEELHGKSFYECIDERCLPEAIRCLEGAKANDSIAYLRFVFRDPRDAEDLDQSDGEASLSSDSDDGGVQLDDHEAAGGDVLMQDIEQNENGNRQRSGNSSTDLGGSTESENDSGKAMFDNQGSRNSNSSTSSAPPLMGSEVRSDGWRARRSASRPLAPPMEVEAVISCTSDGLVVIIRAAPPGFGSVYANGLFAAPWAAQPIMPQNHFAPLINPGGPPADDFMRSIRDVAVFAWALTGINGNIASYSHGTPRGEAAPPNGFPVWDPNQKNINDLGPENQAVKRWAERERMETAATGHQIPFQENQMNPFTNYNSGSSIGITNPVLHAHITYQNGHGQRDTQYEQSQQQYGRPAATPTINQVHSLPNQTTNNDQMQGPSGGSYPVRYMWY